MFYGLTDVPEFKLTAETEGKSNRENMRMALDEQREILLNGIMYEELPCMEAAAGSGPEVFILDKKNELFRVREEKISRLPDAVWDATVLGGITLIYEVIIGAFIGVHSSFWTLAPIMIYFSYCLIKVLGSGAAYWKHALIPYYPYLVREGTTLKVIACMASDMRYLLNSRKVEEDPELIPKELLRGEQVNGFYILEYHNCSYLKESSRFYFFRADTKKRKNKILKLPKIYHNHDRLKELN